MTSNRTTTVLALCAVVILAIGAVTDIDMWLAHAMAGNGPVAFPLRHAWFAETVNHKYIKRIMIVLAACFILPVAYDLWRPRKRWDERLRLRMRLVALSALLVPLAVSLLKRLSYSHCPWDLVAFGGDEPYVRLLQPLIAGVPAGHCMPAGHASSALWLVSLAVFWLPEHPRKAALMGAAMLLLGFVIGWIQQLRGAHFLTHTLWSMWIACAIVSTMWRVAMRNKHYARLYQVS
ncbi:phosphatase PAP2 family protein [Massilia sp. CF038]|uniref:phosphatase PAP2 family protein n=1 Tax=Massilia sp. CF038 TaxID=1881045 RepID=UPI0009202BA8|nr:phosphatase PAP2 family protein [Massilia sp. CF038]SHH30512.1 Membrane-associated enzyme, PAP2 (acid phosphatase) superfamily [Massilia sp. CF038]